jgi:hypothetical protein
MTGDNMAPIRFACSIWNTEGIVAGHAPLNTDIEDLGDPPDRESAEDRVLDLIYGADYTIRPETGYFFETMGQNPEMIVVGFAFEVPEHLGRPGTEVNYILYATHAKDFADRSIRDAIGKLSERKKELLSALQEAADFRDVDVGSVDITPMSRSDVQEERIARETLETVAPADRYDRPATDRTDEEDPDEEATAVETEPETTPPQRNEEILEVVALLWEQFRRDTGTDPLRASLEEVELFIHNVPGALSHLKFSSKLVDESIPEHFNVFGGERTQIHDYGETFEFLLDLAPEQELTWETLPRFEDELHGLIERRQETLGTDPATIADDSSAAAVSSEQLTAAVTEQIATDQTVGGYMAAQVSQGAEFESFYLELWEEFANAYANALLRLEPELREQTREQFRAAVDPEYTVQSTDDEDDDGTVSSVIGSISSPFESEAKELDIETVVAQSDGAEIDEAQLEMITESVIDENRDLIDDIVRTTIEQELKEAVEARTRERIAELTRRTVDSAAEIRTTDAFEQTDDDSVWPS